MNAFRIASAVARAAAQLRGARLTILIYHRVLDSADPFNKGNPDVEQFRWQMQTLGENFRVIDLDSAVAALRANDLPERAACVTFDDGYADNLLNAAPILCELGISATFFIATDYLDGGLMWNDAVIETVRTTAARSLDLTALGLGVHDVTVRSRRPRVAEQLISQIKYRPVAQRIALVEAIADVAETRLPTDLMMTTAQLQRLSAHGMGIGAHTCSHPILAGLGAEEARQEIGDSQRALQELIGTPVKMFAYPNGRPGRDYDQQAVDIVRELEFDGAVTTAWGAAPARGADLYQLPRFTPWDLSPDRFAAGLWRNYHLQ